ncbi:MAG: hypothetical protein ABW135_02875 [Thermoleophilaceae bacterium]
MTPVAPRQVGRWGSSRMTGGPRWLRPVVLIMVLVVAFVAAQTCQKSQIRLNKDQAIAKAQGQIDFTPKRTQIRLLRQGLNSKPFWIVSLSSPGTVEGTFSELAVVRIDANTGKVASVRQQGSAEPR